MGDLVKPIVLRAVVVLLSTCPAVAQAFGEADKRAQAERLVSQFWERVWTPKPDLTAIDELLVDDFVLTTAGSEVKGRQAFEEWVKTFQATVTDIRLEAFETSQTPMLLE